MTLDPLHWILNAVDSQTNLTHLVYCAVGGFADRSVLARRSSFLAFGPVFLDELEAFGFVVREAGLEQYRVHPELRVQQWHVSVHFDEEVDALVPLVEVRVVVGQGLGTAGTAERPARRDLDGWLAGDV